jgi:hypothetical protein
VPVLAQPALAQLVAERRTVRTGAELAGAVRMLAGAAHTLAGAAHMLAGVVPAAGAGFACSRHNNCK